MIGTILPNQIFNNTHNESDMYSTYFTWIGRHCWFHDGPGRGRNSPPAVPVSPTLSAAHSSYHSGHKKNSSFLMKSSTAHHKDGVHGLGDVEGVSPVVVGDWAIVLFDCEHPPMENLVPNIQSNTALLLNIHEKNKVEKTESIE